MADSFATAADLATFTGRTFTDDEERQAEMLLASATAAIRRYCKQRLSYVEEDAVTLRGGWSPELLLPETPVVEIVSVEVDGVAYTENVDWYLASDRLIRGSRPTSLVGARPSLHWGGPNTLIDVVYTHGMDPVDEDVRGVCIGAAARVMAAPTGVQSETVGGYSVTYSFDAQSAAVKLTNGDRRTLRPWRRTAVTQ